MTKSTTIDVPFQAGNLNPNINFTIFSNKVHIFLHILTRNKHIPYPQLYKQIMSRNKKYIYIPWFLEETAATSSRNPRAIIHRIQQIFLTIFKICIKQVAQTLEKRSSFKKKKKISYLQPISGTKVLLFYGFIEKGQTWLEVARGFWGQKVELYGSQLAVGKSFGYFETSVFKKWSENKETLEFHKIRIWLCILKK